MRSTSVKNADYHRRSGGPLSQTRKGNEKWFLLKHRRLRFSSLTRMGPRLWKTNCFIPVNDRSLFLSDNIFGPASKTRMWRCSYLSDYVNEPPLGTSDVDAPQTLAGMPSSLLPHTPPPVGLIAINFSGMTGYCPGGHVRLVARGQGGRGSDQGGHDFIHMAHIRLLGTWAVCFHGTIFFK